MLNKLFRTLILASAVSQAATIAYDYPVQTGNQSGVNGSLGMDFNVNSTITVTNLGVFDSGADGLQRPITVYLYDRNSQAALASLVFATGNTGTLIDGERFLPLLTPLVLNAGFQGSIVAENYGFNEPNGNTFGAPNTFLINLNTGGGVISFVGTSRYGNAGSFPVTLDSSVARYGAGTFEFTSNSGSAVPEPQTFGLLGLGLIGIYLRRKRNTT